MCHPTRGFAFVELKSQKGRLTKVQVQVLDRMGETAGAVALSTGPAKVRVHVWRPNDFPTVGLKVLSRGEGPILFGF